MKFILIFGVVLEMHGNKVNVEILMFTEKQIRRKKENKRIEQIREYNRKQNRVKQYR